MKKNTKKFSSNSHLSVRITICAIAVAFLSVGICGLFRGASIEVADLVDISELSDEFVEDYFAQMSDMSQNAGYDKANMLIVTSLQPIADVYGAAATIAGPNHQYFLQYNSTTAKDSALAAFVNDDTIVGVDENQIITLDDIEYNSWGITKMGLDPIIESSSMGPNDVTVAIIDTGCDVDLIHKYYGDRVLETYDVSTRSSVIADANDTYGHGTHVTGILAESTPSNVKILPVKITSGKSIATSDVITAINYITRYNKADVINMSFSGSAYNLSEYNAIAAANSKNIISVAAAGNNGKKQNAYPAAFDNTISIASVDSDLNKSSFSQYGSTIDFAAPGTDVKSTLSDSMQLAKKIDGDPDFEVLSGTSMATPHAAGATAILKSYNKNLTKEDVIGLLTDYATIDLGDAGKDDYYGNGFISFKSDSLCSEPLSGNCEPFGVFATPIQTSVSSIAIKNLVHADYNYWSLNNLYSIEVTVTFSNNVIRSATIGELKDAEIIGYSPSASGEQDLALRWRGLEVRFKYTNPSNWDTAWQYAVLDNGAIELTGTKNSQSDAKALKKKVYLPETVDGYTVSGISGFSASKNNIAEIILPATLAEIAGDKVFGGMNQLERITSLRTQLSIVGDEVFSDNPELTNIDGASLFISGQRTFSGDPLLASVALDESMSSIPEDTFNGCASLTNFELSKNITAIGARAFALSGLEQISIPDSVITIGDDAFNRGSACADEGNCVIVWTSSDVYAATYVKNNNIPYEFTNISDADISSGRYSFAPMTVFTDDVDVYFDRGVMQQYCKVVGATECAEYGYRYQQYTGMDGRKETIRNDTLEVIYQNAPDHFSYGDTYFTVKGTTQYGENFEKTFSIIQQNENSNYTIKEDGIIVPYGSTLASLSEQINAGASIQVVEHYDKNKNLSNSDILKTGDKLTIAIDGARFVEYDIVVRGDVDGNGEVGIIDYIRIKKDIMDTSKLDGIYREAADMNANGKIDIIDYIRIKKIIMETQ